MATRRGILRGVVVFAGAWAIVARPWTWFASPDLVFEPLEGLAPFRRLASEGEMSGGGAVDAVFAGLTVREAVDPVLDARLRGDLPAALWGDWDGTGPVPVTYFTDIRCPICRVLEARLPQLAGIQLTTREFPVFGEVSEHAARAIVTAQRQGQGEAMRQRLHRGAGALSGEAPVSLAERLGLDGAQFARDYNGLEVSARLEEDRALARILRLPGTPILVIGRTRITGLAPTETLRAVVDIEAREGPDPR